jgi:hypothetical protein
MTNSKRSAHNRDAAAVQCKLLAKNSATPVLKARHYCCSAECPPLAQSGHCRRAERCPLSGVKPLLTQSGHGRHRFRNGYASNAPEMLVEVRGIRRVGKGRDAEYAIRLGRIRKILRWRS